MRTVFNSILEYYQTTDIYTRNLCLGFSDTLIYLNSDYPYYCDGIRYVDMNEEIFYVDLIFFTRFSSYLINRIEIPSQFTFIVVSNESNLSRLDISTYLYNGFISLYFNVDMHGVKISCLPFVHLYFTQYLNWLDSGLSLVYESSYISCYFNFNDMERKSLLLNSLDLSLLNKSSENEICLYIKEISYFDELNMFISALSNSFKSITGFSNLSIHILFKNMSIENLSILSSYFDDLDLDLDLDIVVSNLKP